MKNFNRLLKHVALMFVAFLLISQFAYGQTSSTRQTQSKPDAPAIKVREGDKDYNLKVSLVDIDVKVVGSLAITTIDITFRNDLPRILEGELVFPLGENQTVSRLAMDINGKLREGVPVEKAKGRQVFEEIVRRGIDPALLEQTQGNMFRARVYPIPANGTKRVVIGYEEILQKNSDGLMYSLPLNFKDELDKFILMTTVYSSGSTPEIDHKLGFRDLNFDKQPNSFVIKTEYNNYVADQPFEFNIPFSEENENVMIENDRNRDYFVINFNPPSFDIAKPTPQKICILWDASSSMKKRDIEKETKLLTSYFNKYQNIAVKVIVFSNEIDDELDFAVMNGDSKKLIDFLSNIKYDGGTQLGVLDLKNYTCDEFLLFSDGMTNFGKREIHLSNSPVYAINSMQIADFSYLQYLAQSTGGNYINLLNSDDDESFKKLTGLSNSFISADYDNSEISETFPSLRTPVTSNFLFCGILNKKNSRVTLNFGYGKTIVKSETFDLNKDSFNVNSGILSRLWAKIKIAELNLNFEKNKNEISEIGKEFSIVTKNTSLIILDRVEDYIKFNIKPPADLLAEFNEKQNIIKEDKSKEEIQQSKNVKDYIDKFTKWWNAEYTMKDTVAKVTPRPTYNGSTGILKGNVKDIFGKNLIGASVKVEATRLGAFTKEGGNFIVRNILPGRYNVRINFVGCKSTTLQNIQINSNQDTEIEVILDTANFNTQEIYIYSEYDSSSSNRNSATEDVGREGVERVVGLSAGVFNTSGGFVVRGSREDETQVRVDGSDVGNQFTGSFGAMGSEYYPMISSFAAEEEQVLSGGPTAEFGDLSGVYPNPNQSESDTTISKRMTNNKSGKISVKSYSDTSQYFVALELANINDFYSVYLKWKEEFSKSPFFYIDAADLAESKKLNKLSLKIISNLAELDYENTGLLRILAARLKQMKNLDLAILIYREVLKFREEEPQSYRDLALVLADNGEYQESADLLYKVITSVWDSRFREVEMISVNELNKVINDAKGKVNVTKYNADYLNLKPVDVRIVLNWDADNTDIDLWVKDPMGENCGYSHPLTRMGCRMSRDITGGYGPEEFMVRNAKEGNYSIRVNYFGSRSQKLLGPVTVYLEIYTNYGKPNEKKEIMMARLKDKKNWVDIGSIEFKK